MDKKQADKVIEVLSKTYTNAETALEFHSEYELLIAVMLSAQCTDKRVNIVTKELFKEYNTPYKMVTLSQPELEGFIKTCGLYHSKANHILSASNDIINKFDGKVPNTVEQLQTLKGVGRKTANVVFSVGFGGQAIAVDTHVFRVSNRIGLADAKDVYHTELELNRLIDRDLWGHAHHFLIKHGREVCKAQRPLCKDCVINKYCKFYQINNN